MKNCEGKKNCSSPLFQFAPTSFGAHALFCAPLEAMHAVTIISLKAIDLYNYLYTHVDQQIDSSVFTEVHSDHRE